MYRFFKRTADFSASFLGLLLLSPLLVPLVILLKLTGEGKVFYLQERVGLNGKPFRIIKFATMLENSINMGMGATTLRNDPRITPVGKYLRITKVNELPQIINVVLGDMSLVGPRPLLYNSYKKYSPEVQEIIYKNRPGVTGIGSLIFRDEEKLVSEVKKLGGEPLEFYMAHIYPYKGVVETWYYHHISFATDLKILFLTFWQLVAPQSDLVFSVFKDIPPKPEVLTVDGIRRMFDRAAVANSL